LKKITNTTFSKCILIIAAAAPLFTGCKKDTATTATTTATLDKSDTVLFSKTLATTKSSVPLKNMFGVNSYAWDFLQNPSNPNDVSALYLPKMNLINSFTMVRHYLDWNLMESKQGNYTFNPCAAGSWNLDAIYAGAKAAGITILADIKCCPDWLVKTYPTGQQDAENVPAPYGLDRSAPASYILQGKMAFQFAARYGSNAAVDKSQVSVYAVPRWTADPINVVKIGLGLVKYIECDNERDKWWKGAKAEQTAEEYAANMSAFYDGDMGKLGKNVGVKNADPNMVVVMGGLASANFAFVQGMINWCKTHRGYRADGSVNLCFDVINYHYYNEANNIGLAPELSNAASNADQMVAIANSIPNKPEVWITESGYDINAQSNFRAPAIGSKSALLVQGDWIVRSSLLYLKHGIKRLFYYQLFDAFPNNPTQFSTSGLTEQSNLTRRPAANYLLQLNALMGGYTYQKTIYSNPMVDIYSNGTKYIYALYQPTASNKSATYNYKIAINAATIYKLNPTGSTITNAPATIKNGSISVTIGETPIFITN